MMRGFRYRRSGWFGESFRHSLAARGYRAMKRPEVKRARLDVEMSRLRERMDKLKSEREMVEMQLEKKKIADEVNLKRLLSAEKRFNKREGERQERIIEAEEKIISERAWLEDHDLLDKHGNRERLASELKQVVDEMAAMREKDLERMQEWEDKFGHLRKADDLIGRDTQEEMREIDLGDR